MRRPLLGLAAAFASGCLLSDGEAGPAGRRSRLGRARAAVLLGLALAARAGRAAGVALAGAALSLGAAASAVEVLQLESRGLRGLALEAEREGRPLRLVGTVRGDAVERWGRLTFAIDVAGVEAGGDFVSAAGRACVDLGGRAEAPRLADGDGVAAWVSVCAPLAKDGVRAGLSAFGLQVRAARREPRRNRAGPLRRAARGSASGLARPSRARCRRGRSAGWCAPWSWATVPGRRADRGGLPRVRDVPCSPSRARRWRSWPG
jgi:hypothetical protein